MTKDFNRTDMERWINMAKEKRVCENELAGLCLNCSSVLAAVSSLKSCVECNSKLQADNSKFNTRNEKIEDEFSDQAWNLDLTFDHHDVCFSCRYLEKNCNWLDTNKHGQRPFCDDCTYMCTTCNGLYNDSTAGCHVNCNTVEFTLAEVKENRATLHRLFDPNCQTKSDTVQANGFDERDLNFVYHQKAKE